MLGQQLLQSTDLKNKIYVINTKVDHLKSKQWEWLIKINNCLLDVTSCNLVDDYLGTWHQLQKNTVFITTTMKTTITDRNDIHDHRETIIILEEIVII